MIKDAVGMWARGVANLYSERKKTGCIYTYICIYTHIDR